MEFLVKILPAYLASASAVVLGGGHPIDMGKRFIDGRRVLGDGKTVEGFLGGWAFGGLVGFLLFPLFSLPPLLSFLISFGAMLGDALGSFVKRRLGFERGASVPLLDQESLLLGVFILKPTLFSPLEWLLLLIMTPVLHRLTNIMAFKLGLKGVPW